LQTYRQINLTIQSVFFVLGTFLLSQILETESKEITLFLEDEFGVVIPCLWHPLTIWLQSNQSFCDRPNLR
jgi:hypothetical protein